MKLVLCAALCLMATPVAASPCTSDFWQPTFVHDLENEDGPWYVTSAMSFVKLRWEQNGGYVPHACELVRGPQDTRDRRGFTTCQDYTRIQCGCSRDIPGNRTCAAFLAFHTAAPPPPGGGFTGPGGLFGQPSGGTISLSPGDFQRAAQFVGTVVAEGNSIILRGGAWTNGRVKNGVRDGNRILSVQYFDFSGGGDAYMRMVVNGGGKYMAFWPRVLEGVGVKTMSTHHSWAGSLVVNDNETLFAHVHVWPGGNCRIAVATGGYDDQGGRVIYASDCRLPNLRTRLDLQFVDNYAGDGASIVLTEALVRVASSPGPGPGAGGGQPPGSRCTSDSDCAGGVCLLGVCSAR